MIRRDGTVMKKKWGVYMKKLAILEDRPWIMRKMLEPLRNQYMLNELIIIYYDGPKAHSNENANDILEEYATKGVKVCRVNNLNFEKTLNDLFGDEERIFFFNLVLTNDNASYFEDRINVVYAKKKKEYKRIWFYTTADRKSIHKVKKEFGEQFIPVSDYISGEEVLLLDIESVKDIF